MNRLLYVIAMTLMAASCSNDSAENTAQSSDSNQQPDSHVTWKTRFPSLWNNVYAAEVSPDDITYQQFIQAVADRLKTDSAFQLDVKGDTGDTGPAGPQGLPGLQGPQGEDGADGSDATLPAWEIMYTFGTGDTYFHTCSPVHLCTADDIDFHQLTVNETLSYYYLASLSAEPIAGTDHLNTEEPISNIHAESDCEYKAELLTVNSAVARILFPETVHDGGVAFRMQAAFSTPFKLVIGDASVPLRPRLYLSKDLPYSFSATQDEKDRVANEFNNVGTTLGHGVVLKRRCR